LVKKTFLDDLGDKIADCEREIESERDGFFVLMKEDDLEIAALLKLEERGDKGDSDDDLFNILKE
jgi:hypothetical protein